MFWLPLAAISTPTRSRSRDRGSPQTKPASAETGRVEECAYEYVGATSNNLLVAISSYNSGGTGLFHTLHILDAAATRGFDLEGERYGRLALTEVRSIVLGDRWDGEVKIAGSTIAITTSGRAPNGQPRRPSTVVVVAKRP